jgi:hypothetical protein
MQLRALPLSDALAPRWNALRGADDHPCLRLEFLQGLEATGCIQPRYGWTPAHLGLFDGEQLAMAVPAYRKGNSHGEFVFDHSWAEAYAQHGLDYYPKLLVATPYSPITGPRWLTSLDADTAGALITEILPQITRQSHYSSVHLNFLPETTARALARHAGWLHRQDVQFHWHQRGWRDFDDFTDSLTSKRRKEIRRERRLVRDAGIEVGWHDGTELSDDDLAFCHACYRRTQRDKGNHAALTLEFFRHLRRVMPEAIAAAIARRDGAPIAMAFYLRSSTTLYGRYWGALDTVAGLHFECCYYQGIEHAIARGLSSFEPGAQGEHKLARGFLPVRTHSLHWIAHADFRRAIAAAVAEEAAWIDGYEAELRRHSPFAAGPA